MSRIVCSLNWTRSEDPLRRHFIQQNRGHFAANVRDELAIAYSSGCQYSARILTILTERPTFLAALV
jgi:hypothetical protein